MRKVVGLMFMMAATLAAISAAKAGQYPPGLREFQGPVSLCEDSTLAKKIADVRQYGIAVTEDAMQVLGGRPGKSGKSICRDQRVDLSNAVLKEVTTIDPFAPTGEAPLQGWIVDVQSGPDEYWILWFMRVNSA